MGARISATRLVYLLTCAKKHMEANPVSVGEAIALTIFSNKKQIERKKVEVLLVEVERSLTRYFSVKKVATLLNGANRNVVEEFLKKLAVPALKERQALKDLVILSLERARAMLSVAKQGGNLSPQAAIALTALPELYAVQIVHFFKPNETWPRRLKPNEKCEIHRKMIEDFIKNFDDSKQTLMKLYKNGDFTALIARLK